MEDKINQFIENQQKALADFKTQLLKELSPKTEFEVGRWYKTKSGSLLSRFDSCNNHHNGFWIKENYRASDCTSMARPEDWELATESEVKEALIKEAEKKYDTIENGTQFTFEGIFKNIGISLMGGYKKEDWSYNSESDTLKLKGFLIYKQGQWAAVVKEEAIKIGGYEVKFVHVSTFIDGHEFTKEFWECALKISEHSKAGVYVGCDAKILGHNKWYVSPEQIKSILEKLK